MSRMSVKCAVLALLAPLLARLAAADECSCSLCCEMVPRPPSMMVHGSDTMCALKPPLAMAEGEEACPAMCTQDPATKAVSSSGDSLDYNRFCFMYCQAQKTLKDPGQPCEDLSKPQLEAITTVGGNGKDQAILLKPEGEALETHAEEQPQASDEEAKEEVAATEAAKAAVQAVMEPGVSDNGTYVAMAAGKSAIAAGMEARLSEAEAKSMRMLAASTAALATARAHASQIHQLSATVMSSEMQATIYGKSAVNSLKEARLELQEIRQAAQSAAKEAGAQAAAEMNAKADEAWAKVAKFEAKWNPKGPAPMAEAANRAAGPYYAAMSKAMGIRLLYATKAQELSQTAQDLQRNAQILATQAQSYAAAGSKLAPGMMSTAKGMLGDATRINGEAQQWQTVAAKISQDIPTYQVAAMAAAARAAVLANPAGQPPPPAPPMLLQAASRLTTLSAAQAEAATMHKEVLAMQKAVAKAKESPRLRGPAV